jgi:hypothetical protein
MFTFDRVFRITQESSHVFSSVQCKIELQVFHLLQVSQNFVEKETYEPRSTLLLVFLPFLVANVAGEDCCTGRSNIG